MQRNCPLTLIFRNELSFKSVLRIKQILENENSLNSKLKFEFSHTYDLKDALDEINHEQHPILNKYISY